MLVNGLKDPTKTYDLNDLPNASKRDEITQLAEGYDTYSKPDKELTDFYKRLFDANKIMKANKTKSSA